MALAAALYFFVLKKDDGAVPGFSKDDPHSRTIAANNLNCGLSAKTDSGAYYISGTSQLKNNNLNPKKLDGDPIRVVGYVYGDETKENKIGNVKIEIWQADSYGSFHPAAKGKASDFTADQLAFRGFVNSDEFGYFEFTSVYPGGSADRARHIYLRATATGYKDITTQLVMSRSGDYVSTNDDSIAAKLPNCNVINFGAVDGMQTAGYDIHLEKAPETAQQ